MSAASSLPYKLRPNKAVDREIFLSFLVHFSEKLNLSQYKYIGLGGPFLEDFRLIHNRVGIKDMDCIEKEEATHKRQKFNRPTQTITCVNDSLEEYLESSTFDKPVILWLDYTDPQHIVSQIQTFSRQIETLPFGSILRITLNASPASLGKPDVTQLGVNVGGKTYGEVETVKDWRLKRFREKLGSMYPTEITAEGMTHKNYGKSLLKVLSKQVSKTLLELPTHGVVWALSTHYSDGQPMVTSTAVLVRKEDSADLETLIKKWEYHSCPSTPHLLDLPALSILERLTIERGEPLGEGGEEYALPSGQGMDKDPMNAFRKFYKVFPYFSQVNL